MKRILAFAVAIFVGFVAAAAYADLNYTQGSGTVLFDFICFATKHCPVHVNVNSAGTELFTNANPGSITPSSGAVFTITPSGTATVSGTVQVTQSSAAWVVTPTTGAFLVTPSSPLAFTPTNGSIFVTTPTNGAILVTTPTNGAQVVTASSAWIITPPTGATFPIVGVSGGQAVGVSPSSGGSFLVQPGGAATVNWNVTPSMAGGLTVNCVNGCAASNNVTTTQASPTFGAIDQGKLFIGGSGMNPIAGVFTSTIANIIEGEMGVLRMDAQRQLMINIATPTVVQVTPASSLGTLVTGTIYVGNANANGQTTMANSSPVAIASDQSAITATISSPTFGAIDQGNFHLGSSGMLPIAGVFTSTIANIIDGEMGILRMDAQRQLRVVMGGGDGSTTDPCTGAVKSFADVNTSVTGATLIPAASSLKNYICSFSIVAMTATAAVSFIEGTGAGCNTGTSDTIWGAASTLTGASAGTQFTANGGISHGDGNSTVAKNTTANQNTCLQFNQPSGSTTPTVAVHVGYVQK